MSDTVTLKLKYTHAQLKLMQKYSHIIYYMCIIKSQNNGVPH